MQIYRIFRATDDGDLVGLWHETTLDNAHEIAKHNFTEIQRPEVRIELFDQPTDKFSLVELINRLVTGEPLNVSPLRTWMLTPRGGIKEVPNGE
jgi:hypothetical protein